MYIRARQKATLDKKKATGWGPGGVALLDPSKSLCCATDWPPWDKQS